MSLILQELDFEVRTLLKVVEIHFTSQLLKLLNRDYHIAPPTTHIDCGGTNSSTSFMNDRFEKTFQAKYLVPSKGTISFLSFIEISVVRFDELSSSKPTLCLLNYGDFNRSLLDLML